MLLSPCEKGADMQIPKCQMSKIVSEYDQEMLQSQSAGKPMTPRRRASQHSLDTRKTDYVKQTAHPSPSR